MRLLDTSDTSKPELIEFHDDVPPYAILSHRWVEGEVTFEALTSGSAKDLQGWTKVEDSCRIAHDRGFKYIWIDSCCIDKSSSAELTESINSMYRWYKEATECYAFLFDVHGSNPSELKKDVRASKWFTRGWTLQELIAPSEVLFYNSQWKHIWSKSENDHELSKITFIPRSLLNGTSKLSDYSVAQRMSWAANRQTTRREDEAYCLLGIFQVNMPMLYGEGETAFRRLQEEIIKQYDDQTLFCWHKDEDDKDEDDKDVKPVLAPRARCFKDLHNLRCIYATNDSRSGFTMSNAGLSIDLMLIPWAMNIFVAPLSCGSLLPPVDRKLDLNVRDYRRQGIFLHQTDFRDHLVRVSVDKKDTVWLDSDTVAYKRDSLKIVNRRVFIRQYPIDLIPKADFAFNFQYSHPRIFGGPFPSVVDELLDLGAGQTSTFTTGNDPYSHYELAAFNIQSLAPDKRPCYLHFAYDINFRPLCCITRELEVDNQENRAEKHEFEGMRSPSKPGASSLAWLLAQACQVETADSGVASNISNLFKIENNYEELNLKITFELKKSVSPKVNGIPSVKRWSVTLAPLDIDMVPSSAATFSSRPQESPVTPFEQLSLGQTLTREGTVRRVRREGKQVRISFRSTLFYAVGITDLRY